MRRSRKESESSAFKTVLPSPPEPDDEKETPPPSPLHIPPLLREESQTVQTLFSPIITPPDYKVEINPKGETKWNNLFITLALLLGVTNLISFALWDLFKESRHLIVDFLKSFF